jgi:N-acetylmuramoyl-L-alanine amidase
MASKKLNADNVEYIIIHCSETSPAQDIGVTEIDRMHRAKGSFGCGFHYVIRQDGTVEVGRNEGTPGLHTRGYNHCSIGICLVGGIDLDGNPDGNYSESQFCSLEEVLYEMQSAYPNAKIVGHNELDDAEFCPSFNVQEWLQHTDLLD